MIRPGKLSGRRQSEVKPEGHEAVWAVVLAGGEGLRLRRLARRVCGDERPKQFCPLFGSRTLVRETLDRVGRLIPPERTVVVGMQSHARYQAGEFGGQPGSAGPYVLNQPDNRGTGAAVLLAALWIEAREPQATVVFFPSDHFIGEEQVFVTHVSEMVDLVKRQPEWTVLLGVPASGPETEYGWIEPGQRVGWTGPSAVYGIRRFQEKPSKEVAEALFAGGCLWNTFVFAARLSAVLAAGRECVPSLYERLVRVSAFWGSEHERWALHHAYSLAPTVNFSEAILEACSLPLAVLEARGLTWCDLGSPERVVKTLVGVGVSAPWLAASTSGVA
jgi:mannose-1-phosphate guanylyltransferase